MSAPEEPCLETQRQQADARRTENWKRWGPYLAERQWGTVREDYSPSGDCWSYFPHDHARSRAYRWGEDGLLGITDRQCRLCFATALWNGKDPILKERMFGLTGPEGSHGEDVKDRYFYLDSTPTHSYMKALYKYPQMEFPYGRLVAEAKLRSKKDPELELEDLGAFDGERYFDVTVEYAKATDDDILIRITAANRGPEAAPLAILPTLWFRNTWSWGRTGEGYSRVKPSLGQRAGAWVGAPVESGGDAARATRPDPVLAATTEHESLGRHIFSVDATAPTLVPAELIFTENETNFRRLYGSDFGGPAKDAFHEYVCRGRREALARSPFGTKVAALLKFQVPSGGTVVVRARLSGERATEAHPFGEAFDALFARRIEEADRFYAARIPRELTPAERAVARQGYAGLLWTKQFYHFSVKDWLEGDPSQPPAPEGRKQGRNRDWGHLYNRDIISMPDKWEYPWYAAWDLAFHMIPFARVDPAFAKSQLLLLLREWYMHPNGQIPAYEFAFGDVNPPVHAWACWRVYKMTGQKKERDKVFLARVFQKLLINFTWWVNRKDVDGKHIFSGGFLGLDNIGVFDRSRPLPTGGYLEQADGTAWMAFYCATMLSMALELAQDSPAYEDAASKFFEHFVAIVDAMNSVGGTGLWNEEDGFYYDQLHAGGGPIPLRIRSIVGLIPLFAVEVLEQETLDALPGFTKRMRWFLENRSDLGRHISYVQAQDEGGAPHASAADASAAAASSDPDSALWMGAGPKAAAAGGHGHRLLAIPSKERLLRVLRYLLDEKEFLSPFGIRSLSAVHREHPFVFEAAGERYVVPYTPGESDTWLFGGNSNWRGPVWFPVNYLFIEALQRYHHFYGDALKVECPTGSGQMMTLLEVSILLSKRLADIFLPDADGKRPCHGTLARYAEDPAWRDLVLFHEYFHGDTGAGLGAGHQTGWTALVVRCLEGLATVRRVAGRAGMKADPAVLATSPEARAELSRRIDKEMRARPS